MKHSFMQYERSADLPDWAGKLILTAENSDEVATLQKGFRLFGDGEASVLAYADALRAGTLSHAPGTYRGGYYWFEVETSTGCEWFQAYTTALERVTGYVWPAGRPLNVPGLVSFASWCIRTAVSVDHESFCFHGYELGKDSTDAENRAIRRLCEDIGVTKQEPEYVPTARGQYKQNPNYLKRHAPTPAVSSRAVWSALCAAWEEDGATQAQKDVLHGCRVLAPNLDQMVGHGYPTLPMPYSFYSADPAGTCDYDGKGTMARVYTAQEFRELGEVR